MPDLAMRPVGSAIASAAVEYGALCDLWGVLYVTVMGWYGFILNGKGRDMASGLCGTKTASMRDRPGRVKPLKYSRAGLPPAAMSIRKAARRAATAHKVRVCDNTTGHVDQHFRHRTRKCVLVLEGLEGFIARGW